MPRDGSGIYTTPPGTTAVPDTTIESAKYNNNVADVAADLNAPRPVVAGGTGATSAAAARTNLQTEVASAHVTNYDTHPFKDGSFYSQPGATNAPTAGFVAGVCYGNGLEAIALEARDLNAPNVRYMRFQVSAVWGPWITDNTLNDARYVNVIGDTMTGDLAFDRAHPGQNVIFGKKALVPHWAMILGNADPMIGGNTGSHFNLLRYNDAGEFAGSTFTVKRDNAESIFYGPIQHTKVGQHKADVIGAGDWYDTNTTANRFFVGTDAAMDIFRIFAAGPSTNALLIDGASGWVQAPTFHATNGVRYGAGANSISFQWDGVGIQRIVDATSPARLFDVINSPSGGTGAGSYQKLVTGQIFQYGTYGGGGEVFIPFPVTFPNILQSVSVTMVASTLPADTLVTAHIDGEGVGGFNVRPRYRNAGAGGVASQALYWFAVGW